MDAFDEWYRSHHGRLVASLTVLSGDADAATEAADEAFARALERWPKVAAMASPAGWLHQVGANVLRRTMRRRSMERRLHRPDRNTIQPSLPNPELWAAVRALPDRQRTAVVLRYLADLPEADIALAMGITRGTVSSTLTDAKHRLEAALADGVRAQAEEPAR